MTDLGYTLQLMTNLDQERLKAKAIDEAVLGNYEAAILLNKQVLELDPSDIDSLMQLAHAYWQTGSLSQARKYYRQALSFEPNNSLAKKRLALLNALNGKDNSINTANRPAVKVVAIADLIEEPGKTKIIKLSNIGKPEHLSLLKIGEELFLKLRKRRLEARDVAGNFIGCLPDDISKRLINFTNEKGIYEAYVFSIDKNEVKIFIREISKPAKYRHMSSFISEDSHLEIEEDDNIKPPVEETDLDLDAEKILLTPDEIIAQHKAEQDEDEDDDEDDDKETYQEYEE